MDKKGQVAQTMTWGVATFIVIILSFIFIFVTGTLAAEKSVLGLDVDYVSSEDSGIGTQQMLFAILESGVNDLIASGDTSSVSVRVNEILMDMNSMGINCNFVVEGKINLGSGSGKVVSMSLHGEEVRLRC